MLFGRRKRKGKIYQCARCGERIDADIHKQNNGYCSGCVDDGDQPFQIMSLSENDPHPLDINLTDLECKHVLSSKDEPIKRIIRQAEKAYYPDIVLGYHEDKVATSEHAHAIVDKMANDNVMKSVRIVITSNGMVWCDHTYAVLSYIKRGYATLKEIPFYVVVFNEDDTCVHIMGYPQNLLMNTDDIHQAVRNAKRLEYFVRHGGRQGYNWTIGNLYMQLWFQDKRIR